MHKGRKESFLFIRPTPFPFNFLTEWIHSLLARPPLTRYKEREDYKSVMWILEGQVFDLGCLIREAALSRMGLSLAPPNPNTTLGRLPPLLNKLFAVWKSLTYILQILLSCMLQWLLWPLKGSEPPKLLPLKQETPPSLAPHLFISILPAGSRGAFSPDKC